MALSIQEELEEKTASVLVGLDTSGLMKGVLTQVVPQNHTDIYYKLLGDAKRPFWSVSSVTAEQFVEGESFNDRDTFIRPITVVLYADKLNVEQANPVYKLIRQRAIRALNKFRFTGDFQSDSRSCLLYGVVAPRSQVEAAVWLKSTSFNSVFDIRFKTLESRGQ